MLLDALKLTETSKDPATILEALMEIAPAFVPLDENRARTLFGIAGTLAERMNRPDIAKQMRDGQARMAVKAVPTNRVHAPAA